MSAKNRSRRAASRQAPKQNQGVRSVKNSIIRGVIGFFAFLLGIALTACYLLKSETAPSHLHAVVYIVYGCSALLCGILCTARTREPIFPNCFFAGFAELLLVLLCTLIASKAQVTVSVCIPIALSLVCPVLGGIVGKKI